MSVVPPIGPGPHPIVYGTSPAVEAEYDRLRDLARREATRRNECFEESKQAYLTKNGARAKQLSDEGKRHAAGARDYNRQASEYIFREVNAPGRVDADCIDLHGQYVEEAEEILERRIRADRNAEQTHLRIIVGKGNHSAGRVQKLKPHVVQLCGELGLAFEMEENEGRIYVDYTGEGRGRVGETSEQDGRPPKKAGKYKVPQQPQPQPQPQKEEESGLLRHLWRKVEEKCLVM